MEQLKNIIMIRRIMLIITLVILCNCTHKNDRVKIIAFLNSKDVDDSMKAYYRGK